MGSEQRPQFLRVCSSVDKGEDFGLVYERVGVGRA